MAKRPQSARGMRWIRENLLATPMDIGLTLMGIAILVWLLPPILSWAVFDADFVGETREACSSGGACWVFVKVRFLQFLYGFYPESEIWRVNLTLLTFVLCLVPLFIERVRHKMALGSLVICGFPLVAYFLLYGGSLGLEVVETPKWGGLMLTLVIATVGITASLPIGIVLALGRRSEMYAIQKLCIVFIELWRGVPLITVLFMASVMLPLFLPEGVTFDKLVRALVGVTMFSSAYMAEVVRGGLQAIPRGQYEAAQALGLSFWRMMGLIILPQALKKVIPGIVNTFIGLFKDTTLVLVIGMFDLLGIVQAAATDPEWLGYAVEGYVFAGLVYWVFCFAMSRYSKQIENRLNVGVRA